MIQFNHPSTGIQFSDSKTTLDILCQRVHPVRGKEFPIRRGWTTAFLCDEHFGGALICVLGVSILQLHRPYHSARLPAATSSHAASGRMVATSKMKCALPRRRDSTKTNQKNSPPILHISSRKIQGCGLILEREISRGIGNP